MRALSEWPGVPGTPFALLANSDAGLRQGAAALLRALCTDEGVAQDAGTLAQRQKRAELIRQHAIDEPQKTAAALARGVADEDEAVRAPTAAVVRALQATAGAAFAEELVKAGALAEAG